MSYKSELQNNNVRLQGILDQVNALPDGGGGGGLKYASGTVTPASDTYSIPVTDLGFTPKIVRYRIADESKAYDAVSKKIAGFYINGQAVDFRTNAGGTTLSLGTAYLFGEHSPESDGKYGAGTTMDKILVMESSFVMGSAGYFFRAGYEYLWEAWGE